MTQPRSIFPERAQILSGSALKLIAILVMLLDHVAVAFFRSMPSTSTASFVLFNKPYSIYGISRDIGRIAFPIFCFLLNEGFLHTRNRLKYGRNLFLFALISELPWNYVHSGSWKYAKQNVYFTLLLGYLGMWVIEYFWEKRLIQTALILALLFVSVKLSADYGWRGYIFILLMYMLRNERPAQAVCGSCWLYYEWKACFAFIPINLYNGKRGFIQGAVGKYLFYAFYPAHLFILGLLKYIILAG